MLPQHYVDHPRTPPQHTCSSNASLTTSSPAMSIFSKGHASKSSQSSSSIASSPAPRDSFDLYGTSRLHKVTEEPQEKDEIAWTTLTDHTTSTDLAYNQYFTSNGLHTSPITSPVPQNSGLENQDAWSTASSSHNSYTRHSSLDRSSTSVSNRLSTRFGSISRRWKNRSGVGPQLSIITHMSTPASRSGSANSSQIMSPALSAISRHESYISPSPINDSFDDSLHGSGVLPIPERNEAPEDRNSQATTPLLPPVFNELSKSEQAPLVSPLQSPTVAPVADVPSARNSVDTSSVTRTHSPPLSAQPSVRSMQRRSRANTATAPPLSEVPHLQLPNLVNDRWALKLGHADFSIHPEPYLPPVVTLDSYTEFRQNWDQARTNYAKHIARTVEHYGSTSKVFKLTEEKWNSIDIVWKQHHDDLTNKIAPILSQSRPELETASSSPPPFALEKPMTRIQMPVIDVKSGKFPQIGDGEIVGPMSVAPPRSATTKHSETMTPSSSPLRRNFFRFFSGILSRS